MIKILQNNFYRPNYLFLIVLEMWKLSKYSKKFYGSIFCALCVSLYPILKRISALWSFLKTGTCRAHPVLTSRLVLINRRSRPLAWIFIGCWNMPDFYKVGDDLTYGLLVGKPGSVGKRRQQFFLFENIVCHRYIASPIAYCCGNKYISRLTYWKRCRHECVDYFTSWSDVGNLINF